MRVSRYNLEIPTLDTSGGHSDSNAKLAHTFGNPTGSFRRGDSGLQAVRPARKQVLQTSCQKARRGSGNALPRFRQTTGRSVIVRIVCGFRLEEFQVARPAPETTAKEGRTLWYWHVPVEEW
jgi:hypothetical protein